MKNSGGLTFPAALTLLFVGLKLTHYIDWSWWAVLAPMWVGAVIILVVCIAVVGIEAYKELKSEGEING